MTARVIPLLIIPTTMKVHSETAQSSRNNSTLLLADAEEEEISLRAARHLNGQVPYGQPYHGQYGGQPYYPPQQGGYYNPGYNQGYNGAYNGGYSGYNGGYNAHYNGGYNQPGYNTGPVDTRYDDTRSNGITDHGKNLYDSGHRRRTGSSSGFSSSDLNSGSQVSHPSDSSGSLDWFWPWRWAKMPWEQPGGWTWSQWIIGSLLWLVLCACCCVAACMPCIAFLKKRNKKLKKERNKLKKHQSQRADEGSDSDESSFYDNEDVAPLASYSRHQAGGMYPPPHGSHHHTGMGALPAYNPYSQGRY